ncbi:MAG TPA: hypothetical protein VIM29_08795 [Bacillota bacterium]
MNQAKLQLYADLIRYGLGMTVLKEIPFRVMEITPYRKNCFLIKTKKQLVFLWVHQGREENLTAQISIMEHCRRHGFQGFFELITLKSGRLYERLGEREWFYLTQGVELRKFSYRDREQLRSAVKLIADFHISCNNWSLPPYLQGIQEKPNFIDKMTEIIINLNSFKMLATTRISPTKFDRLILSKLPQLVQNAAEAVALLKDSNYLELFSEPKQRKIIINDFDHSNLGFDSQANLYCRQLKKFRCELPLFDLGLFLLKSARFHYWKSEWFEDLYEEYQKYIPISPAESVILKAYLSFPWHLARLAYRYYFNLADWPLHFYIEKLERLLMVEERRMAFVSGLA